VQARDGVVGAIVRPIRRLLAIVVLAGALGAAGTLAAFGMAAPAGAQAFTCTYTVGPTALPPAGGFISVEGNAPGTSVVRIFANGVLAATAPSDPVTGFFSASIFVTSSVEITVAVDDYPGLPCEGVGGTGAGRTPGGAGTGPNGLPRTGSSATGPLVRAGMAALALGAVLVIGARRRGAIRGPR